MRLLTIAVLCLALAIFAACGDDDTDSGDDGGATPTEAPSGPHIRGEITDYQPLVEGQAFGAMRVEGEIEPDTLYARGIVRFDEDVEVFRREGDSEVDASRDDLALNQNVEVTFVGPVTESDPVQAAAGKIVILED